MTPPTRQEALRLLQDVVVGDVAPDAPAVRAALAAFPDLAEHLDELADVQARLDEPVRDVAEIEAEARTQMTVADVATVQRHARPRRAHPMLFALAAIVLCGVVAALWPPNERAPVDGPLGNPAAVRIDRTGPRWSVDPGVPLPPGSRYLVTLEVDGRVTGAQESFACPILLTAEWQQAVQAATAAALVVEVPELGSRQRVVLR